MVELEKKERMLLIQRAIDTLPAGQRAVVVLRDIEGLSYEEVSSITGLNLGTVKSKLSRARLELRDRLRGMI
jgi:RNA polymerase sigma-70 factor (ECF subfamily)